jgi:hypothetical protein
MKINFFPLKNNTQTNFINTKNNISNPVKYSGLNSDTFSFKGNFQSQQFDGLIVQKTIMLRRMALDIKNKKAELLDLNTTTDAGKKKQDVLQKELSEEIKQFQKLQNKTRVLMEFPKRPNAKFLYNSSLTVEEKKEELKKHPEFKTLKQIAQEAGNQSAGEFKNLKNYFLIDVVGDEEYIDTSFVSNQENYEILYENLKDKMFFDDFVSDCSTYKKMVRSTFRKYSLLEKIQLTNVNTDKEEDIYMIPLESKDKALRLKTTIPVNSKYYKSLLVDSQKPVFVPLEHLSEAGFGTKEELRAFFEDGCFDGKTKDVQQDGTTKQQIYINTNSFQTELNLKTLRKAKRNKYQYVKNLLPILHINYDEIEKAAMDGKITLFNKRIIPLDDVGIDFNIPQNLEFVQSFGYDPNKTDCSDEIVALLHI